MRRFAIFIIKIYLLNCLTAISVTGASRGYAFVEYETEREMHRAYEVNYHTKVVLFTKFVF